MENMKKFSNYQYVEGEMNERDKQEVGSKFWNKGKWDNFVLPFLPDDCNGMSLIDMGCNAGIFLKLAEDKGFSHVIGVDADRTANKKAVSYRKNNGGKYTLIHKDMRGIIDNLPLVDYTIFANAHYYFLVHEWLEYLDKLISKSRYCIIVTAQKRENLSRASASTEDIKKYFKQWEQIGEVPELPLDDDPFPRKQWSFCFKSPILERVPVDSLDNGNNQQRDFWEELDKGIDPLKTNYYKRLKDYRKRKGSYQKVWTDEKLTKYMYGKLELYENIKKCGLKKAVLVNSNNRVVDGNHRHQIMKHMGYKTIIIRRV